tara:strand:+ start:1084 stop:3684 length:2601 start_codon:yes stop_codon:yes gene_type:complete
MATKYRVQGPDGAVHVFEGPDDATPAQIESFAAQTFGAAPKISSGIPSARRTGVDQIPGYDKPVPAAPEAPVKRYGGPLPEALMAPIETAVALGTGLISSPIVEASKIGGTLFSGKYGTQEGIRAGEAVGRKVQQFFQPAISPTAQKQVESISNALASTGLQGVPLNVLGDLQRGLTPALRATADTARAPLAARAENLKQTRIRESELAAPRIDAAKDAFDLGLALDPSLSNPSSVTRLKTGAVGTASLQGNLSKINLPQVAKIARDDLGLPETIKLDSKAYESARNTPAISGAYDKVRALPRVAADDAVLADIDNLRVAPTIGDTGQSVAINNFIDTVKGQLQGGADGATAVTSIRQLRRDAQAIYNQQTAGINPPSPEAIARADINMGIARAIETAIENSITDPRLLTDFRAARTALARTYDYERATNLATGVIDPQALAKLAAEGRPLSGKLAKVANVAANFPENMQGGLIREPTFREKLTRSSAAGTVGAIMGSPFGLPGAIIGGGAGAAAGNVAAGVAARRMATPAYQRANAMPTDYRPVPLGTTPADINYAPGQMVPYNFAQQTFTPPNFVIQPNQYGPRVTPNAPNMVNALAGPSAESTMGGIATERARAAAMSRTLGQQAEAQQAAAEATTRKPAGRGIELEWDPITKTYREATPAGASGVVGAPSALESAVAKMAGEVVSETTGTAYKTQTISPKTGAKPYTRITKRGGETTFGREGQAFAMTAEEKIAWNKAKANLAEAAPEYAKLSDQEIVRRMTDVKISEELLVKAREKARAFEDIAARAANDRARQAALVKREQMLDLAEQLQDALGSRPVKTGGQGPKTRAFQRNRLAPEQEVQNALAERAVKIDLTGMANK